MKKIGILNSAISRVIADMGHQDLIAISDAGLPVPEGVQKIDLALVAGIPDFKTTLQAVMEELEIEKAFITSEMEARNEELYNFIGNSLDKIEINKISHEDFKKKCKSVRAVIRTGEFTPYANIILQAGVLF